jgi:hypothetical protein
MYRLSVIFRSTINRFLIAVRGKKFLRHSSKFSSAKLRSTSLQFMGIGEGMKV